MKTTDYLTNEMYDHFIGNPKGLRNLIIAVIFAISIMTCLFVSITKDTHKMAVNEFNTRTIELAMECYPGLDISNVLLDY